MTLLLGHAEWAARAELSRGAFALLADNLARTVNRLATEGIVIPREKALLSREGGRCPRDGTYLEFDPWDASRHRCPRCGESFTGPLHDRFRLYWYQLWLAERALHAAILWRLRGAATHRAVAEQLLEGYADAYLGYPNRDNTLGPGRVFFSTYLESIWLLQLVLATGVLEGADGPSALTHRVRERIVEPSVRLIASYDEGASNRQVWNDVAMLAAGRLLGDDALVGRALHGPSGLVSHLERGLLADGTWYEGENYHLFAHRGLWYGVTLAERAGVPLPAPLVRRFEHGFLAPFLTSLPDLTLPSRRDSQYAISLRQPRFAESCELGVARDADARLGGILARLYDGDAARGDTGQDRTSADVERNLAATALTRADLGWRALLFARAELTASQPRPLPSVILPNQGIAVLRRDRGRAMAALDFGETGGGHGHPDRLNLLLAVGGTRWLEDVGTGSYVERALHWYRSTLAHNAPLANEGSQPRVAGRLLAWDERGAAGWVSAEAPIGAGVTARRTIVVLDGYLVDELHWKCTSGEHVTVDLPWHVDGEIHPATQWRQVTREGSGLPEDGFDFIENAEAARVAPEATSRLESRDAKGGALTMWATAGGEAEWWRAIAPGPPGEPPRRFHVLRTGGNEATIRTVIAWDGAVRDARFTPESVEVHAADGTRHVHARTAEGWQVELHAGAAHSSIDLGGAVAEPVSAADRGTSPARPRVPTPTAVREWTLGRDHYRRSEESWEEAGSPTARVRLEPSELGVRVVVEASAAHPLRVNAEGTENPWDNEPADVNADGVQLYVTGPGGNGGWRLALRPGGAVGIAPIPGWGALTPANAQWRETPGGYEVSVMLPLRAPARGAPLHFALDVLVNDIGPGRARRRGQLVMSGASGEWTYLRGDRHDPGRLIPIVLTR